MISLVQALQILLPTSQESEVSPFLKDLISVNWCNLWSSYFICFCLNQTIIVQAKCILCSGN